jgi:MYXO-CTERM domain-containing protein
MKKIIKIVSMLAIATTLAVTTPAFSQTGEGETMTTTTDDDDDFDLGWIGLLGLLGLLGLRRKTERVHDTTVHDTAHRTNR